MSNILLSLDSLPLTENRKEIIFFLSSKIAELGKVRAIILFGSCAHNRYRYNSDIDLAIIYEYKEGDRRKAIQEVDNHIFDDYYFKYNAKYDYDLYLIRADLFYSNNFKENPSYKVIQGGVILYEKSI